MVANPPVNALENVLPTSASFIRVTSNVPYRSQASAEHAPSSNARDTAQMRTTSNDRKANRFPRIRHHAFLECAVVATTNSVCFGPLLSYFSMVAIRVQPANQGIPAFFAFAQLHPKTSASANSATLAVDGK